jgi:hypothetical protein
MAPGAVQSPIWRHAYPSKTVDSHVRRVCAEYDTVSMWMRTKA